MSLRVRRATLPAIAATGASAFHPVAAPLGLMASWVLLAAIIVGVRL
jgi:hypothetical protein